MSTPRYTIALYINSVPLTPAHLDGTASLGGSESAGIGLARALARQGHRVHIHAQRLAPEAVGTDAHGVTWHDAGEHDETLRQWCEVIDPDVFVSLRMAHVFGRPMRARLRLLWNQDLLVGDDGVRAVLGTSWQVDKYVYVSDYHRQQWEGVAPDLRGHGWVTRNGYDPAHVPTDAPKVAGRICYVSRPERALEPLLQMWPAVKAAVPHAELHITRYQSMYDGEGTQVSAMCAHFDRLTAQVQADVGGIVQYPGGLGKADLYRLIASSEVMWYPGVADFAETSCIAAVEAQACGTVFVGSKKGALPETVPYGCLLDGDALSADYQRESSMQLVTYIHESSDAFRAAVLTGGRAHVQRYTYDAIATDWSRFLDDAFRERYESRKVGVLRQLLQYDDHVPALQVAMEVRDPDAVERCQRVIAGQDMTDVDYGQYATTDVLLDVRTDTRLAEAASRLTGCSRVLDVACGNGAFAIRLALDAPECLVVGLDYSEQNILAARKAAEEAGVADRVSFERLTIWDFDAQQCTDAFALWCAGEDAFDGVFCGEFAEHIADVAELARVTAIATTGAARWVWTMPSGPFMELLADGIPLKRGHVHHYAYDDLQHIFAAQTDASITYLSIGAMTPRGNPVGHWLVTYTGNAEPLGVRDYTHRIVTTRPMPMLSVGIIAHNAAVDLPRCLQTIRRIADEIVVGDCGSTDDTAAIALKAGARVLSLPPIGDMAEGFSEARNRVLEAASGDWFLWLDTDEQLVGGQALRQYLDAVTLRGITIRQVHLQLDAPVHADTPVRCFRRDGDIRFFGAVHEQPQAGDPNRDIWPTLAIDEVQIAHFGYLVDGVRRRKSQERNLPLLVRDRTLQQGRRLSHVLWMREYATWIGQAKGGRSAYVDAMQRLVGDIGQPDTLATVFPGAERLPVNLRDLALYAAAYYEQHFPDCTDALAKLARSFYEEALSTLPGSWEIELSFAGQQGGLRGRRAAPRRAWVRSAADAQALFDMHTAALLDQFRPPVIHTDPFPRDEAA